MITTESAAISAVTYRLKQIEERFTMQEHKITQLAGMIGKLKDNSDKGQIDNLASIMANIRLTIPRKMIREHIQGDDIPLETPKELLPTFQTVRSNRSYEVVKKRWELWKTQIDSGATPAQLAKAWGCERGSVYHAIKNNFVARLGTGRKLVEFPKCMRSAMRAKKRNIK
jgi:uncharacterized coiled-coil protein SlyX